MKVLLLMVALFGVGVYCATTVEPETEEHDLPDYIQTCDQDDPELDLCIKNAIQDMLPKLHKGVKALNIPPLDPFTAENTRFDYKNGAVQGSIAFKGVKIYGISRSQVKDVKSDITDDGMGFEITLFFPRVFIEGTYKADVNLNDLKLNPRGYFNVSMTDVTYPQKMYGVFETINGKKYIRLTEFNLNLDIGNMKIYASGLFPDPQLNAFVLDFINQYWPEMYKMILPETREIWEPMVLNTVNRFLSKVPFEKILTKNRQ